MSRYFGAIVEAALFARACLFFAPTTLCIGIVGAAVFLSAKAMLAEDHTKDSRFFVDLSLAETPHRQEEWTVPGFRAAARPRLKAQHMDACHSGSCLYSLQPPYLGR